MYSSEDHSFAVCAFGQSPYLNDCLRSLREQSMTSHIVVCTSTPNESISRTAQKYQCQLFVNSETRGIASDWNYALAKAGTPLVTIAHQDDLYLPRYAESMLSAVNESTIPLLFFTNYDEIRESTVVSVNSLLKMKRRMLAPLKMKKLQSLVFIRRRMLSLGSAICCPSVTMCLDNLTDPVFKESMKSNLDWQAWADIAKLKGQFIYDPQVLMYHRIHSESETSNLIKNSTREFEDLLMYEQFWPKPIARLLNRVYAAGRRSNSS